MRTFSFLDKSFWTNNEPGFRKCPALVPGFYAGPRGWCLKASPAGARTGAHTPVFVDRSLRPVGPDGRPLADLSDIFSVGGGPSPIRCKTQNELQGRSTRSRWGPSLRHGRRRVVQSQLCPGLVPPRSNPKGIPTSDRASWVCSPRERGRSQTFPPEAHRGSRSCHSQPFRESGAFVDSSTSVPRESQAPPTEGLAHHRPSVSRRRKRSSGFSRARLR